MQHRQKHWRLKDITVAINYRAVSFWFDKNGKPLFNSQQKKIGINFLLSDQNDETRKKELKEIRKAGKAEKKEISSNNNSNKKDIEKLLDDQILTFDNQFDSNNEDETNDSIYFDDDINLLL